MLECTQAREAPAYVALLAVTTVAVREAQRHSDS